MANYSYKLDKMNEKLSADKLLANWYVWIVDSPKSIRIKTTHAAMYFYLIYKAKAEGTTTEIPIDGVHVRKFLKIEQLRSYFDVLSDLIEFGFITDVGEGNGIDPKLISLKYTQELEKEMMLIEVINKSNNKNSN